LRREHFTIFKKGSKGVSYVCAVKRKFRVPGQTFADSIGALISFIEQNPMVRASELAPKFLGISVVPPTRPAETAAPAPADGTAASGSAEAAPSPAAEPPKAEPNLSLDERARISRLQGDLMWLVREGYVTEFIDGRLFAPPPMVEARKKEIENEEHDPENFPEAPPSTETPAAASESRTHESESSHAAPSAVEAIPAEEANAPAGETNEARQPEPSNHTSSEVPVSESAPMPAETVETSPEDKKVEAPPSSSAG
jgi:hypothetical protein